MRLEPVLLVAQDAPPATMPTRRAFLFGGAMLATGLSFGGACGYAIGVRHAAAGAPGPASDDFEKSGDADLDELRRLAVKAPIEELVKHDMLFIRSATVVYPNDRVLWRGLRRLAEEVIAKQAYPNRRIAAGVLIQTINAAVPEMASTVSDLVRSLRACR